MAMDLLRALPLPLLQSDGLVKQEQLVPGLLFDDLAGDANALPCAALFACDDAFPALDEFIASADFDTLASMHPEDALLDEWPAGCETSSLTAAGASDGCAYTQRDDSDADACGSDDDEEEPECGKRPRHRGVQLTLEAVRAVQHLALRAAAARCNMGTTQFKLQCRKLGIARWPHRKLKSLNGLITSCKAASGRMRSEKLKDALTEWTAQLEAVKVDCLARPAATANMPTFVDRIRQWDVKHKYYARKGCGTGEINSCPPPPQAALLPAAPPASVPRRRTATQQW